MRGTEAEGCCDWRGVLGIHLWPTLPTRGTHSTRGLDQPKTPHSPTISGIQPQPSPRTVVLTQPQKVAGTTGPAPSVRPKQPPPTPSTQGLPPTAESDHYSQPHDHNNHYSLHHTADHLQTTQPGLGNHTNLECH